MVGANSVILTILLTLCAVFVVFLIVVSVKLIYTVDKTNVVLPHHFLRGVKQQLFPRDQFFSLVIG